MTLRDRIEEMKQKETSEKKLRELAIHPLVRSGCSRDVLDAYFHGLVFASVADGDDAMTDKNERKILADIAASLGMRKVEADEVIARVQSQDDAGKWSLFQECVAAIKGNEIAVKLYYAQFVQIWASHEYDEKALSGYLSDVARDTGIALPAAKLRSIKKVLECGDELDIWLYDLAAWMGEDALKYFVVGRYGDVSEVLLREHRRRKAAKAKKIRDEEVRIGKARKNFATVIERISEEHKYASSLRRGWDACLKENLSLFAKNDIDWVSERCSRLRELKDIKIEKVIFVATRRSSRRKLVWKLMCMQFVYKKNVDDSEINKMLRAAAEQSCDDFRRRIEGFISRTFC